VPRPYPAYYQTPRLRLQGGNNPIGLAGFAGVSNFAGGDVFLGEAAKPAGTSGRSVSALDAIEYADAFDAGSLYGGAVEYDVSRNTTLLRAQITLNMRVKLFKTVRSLRIIQQAAEQLKPVQASMNSPI